MPRPRILRIGIVLGNTLVEERLIWEQVPVSVGQGARNTFSVPVEVLPHAFRMFVVDQGRYHLRFTSQMQGRISDGASSPTLAELRSATTNARDYHQVALAEAARGRITVGDLTILFQLVVEPPRVPKPRLPASLRGGISDRIDPRLASIVLASLVVHVGLASYSLATDVDADDPRAELTPPSAFRQEVVDLTVVDPPPDTSSAAAPAVADATPHPAGPSHTHSSGRASTAPAARQEVDPRAFADEMTGEDPNGHAAGDTRRHWPSADLDAQIAQARESDQRVDIGESGRTTRAGDPRIGNGRGPVLQETSGVTTVARGAEPGPTVQIVPLDRPLGNDTTLTPDAVLSRIMGRYVPQLQRCYRDYLKTDASARGKVAISFTINSSGRLVSPQASGVAVAVDSCIQARMSGWTFAVPKATQDGEPTEASFDITLQLLP